ncbi:2-keto-4-pentenoate hydratase [Sphingomonas gilva]|uniref:2-keto-4-pentenoate hydratase n=1 Tax=Sphingomonas gilva TaxID=2305907 RepID=A0A396RKF2_9SPHN|nr:2-keto-4-pentenoate hydratase [Sphingomonas gilva]RHW16718.1 2-keto-4-pentenoate hydratase [Sphingomonas gilva]
MDQGQAIAQAFVAARRAARGLSEYPGPIPATLDQAYAIQDRAIALAGDAVAGWKVGRINPPLDAELGSNRLAGPIFADQVTAADGGPMPVFAEGFAAAEAEFLLRIGAAPDPAKLSYSHDEALALIDAVHVGLEIASSPFPGINDLGPLVTISDFGNNHGLVVGAEVPGWRDLGFVDWPVRLLIDGEEAGAANAATMLDGPVGAAAFLFGCLAARGIALRPGQWISSGAVTGVHPVRVGQAVTALFDDGMTVSCTIDAATPEEDVSEVNDERKSG